MKNFFFAQWKRIICYSAVIIFLIIFGSQIILAYLLVRLSVFSTFVSQIKGPNDVVQLLFEEGREIDAAFFKDLCLIAKEAYSDFPFFVREKMPYISIPDLLSSRLPCPDKITIFVTTPKTHNRFDRVSKAPTVAYYFPLFKTILVRKKSDYFNATDKSMTIRHEIFHHLITIYGLRRYLNNDQDQEEEEKLAFDFQFFSRKK